MNIFEFLYETKKIKKPVRLIELFSGYGSQALALKYLNVNFEHYKTCEWAINSIQAYKDIHFTDNEIDYFENQSFDDNWLISWLYQKGISSNYNEPMTKEQIIRLGATKRKKIYNNICATHNLVNIQQVHGENLEIVDTDKYEYILTYSFPCQDLSNQGLKRGFNDNSTRSGMLWEVERILKECKEIGNLPQILVMENVVQVHGEGENTQNFNKWQYELEKLGYKNYWNDLIATDFGIPQTRNRCFMISILGDYNYNFPKKQLLNLRLKDLLEKNVDEKYYISESMLKYIKQRTPNSDYKYTVGISIGNRDSLINAATITTKNGSRPTDNFIIENNKYDYDKKNGMFKKNILVKKLLENNLCKEYDVIRTNFTTRVLLEEKPWLLNNDKCPTLTTSCGDELAIAVKSEDITSKDLRIRKLTPLESFRLQGVKDNDFINCAKNQSDSSLYHLSGDSICVNVLCALFKQFFEE